MKKIFLFISIFFLLFQNNLFAAATFETSLNITASSAGSELANKAFRAYRGITFNPSGNKMYIIHSKTTDSSDGSQDDIFEYSLGTPFDISGTVTFTSEMAVRNKCHPSSGSFQQPGSIVFNNDGTKLIMANELNNSLDNDICIVSLTTPYDISTIQDDDTGIELDAGDTNIGENEAYGIAFNKDGTKMFVTSGSEEESDIGIFEFDLSTGFDVTTATYSNKYLDVTTQSLDNPRGLKFSADGRQIFVVEEDDDEIHQWSLSTAFDLSSSITYRGKLDLTGQYRGIIGESPYGVAQYLEFNNDGSKFYVTFSRWVNNNITREMILQYSLDCPYGIVYCESPVSGSDKGMIGVIESYTEMSKRVMKNNIKPVMHRLEWLRRHRKEDNLTNQNLKFNFSNEMLYSLVKVMPIGTNLSKTNKKKPNDWFYWSEGQVSIGDIESTLRSSPKEIDASAITLGVDKKVNENKFYGYAIQFGRDSSDIGNSAAILDTDNYSLVFYGTLPHEDGRFLDAAVGISTLKTYHSRKKNSVNLSGERDGKQAFGSIKLNKIYYKKNITINPTAKFDFGFTELATFQESGSIDALIYEKHQIPKGLGSLGMSVNNVKTFNNGNILKPTARLEYTADFSPSTNTNVSYVSDTNTDYFIRIGNQSTHNYKAGLGFDLSTVTGLSIILNYEIDYANGSGHTDNLYFITGWVPHRETEYSLSIKGGEKIQTGFNIVKKINGFDLEFNIDTDLLYDNRSQNANVSINKFF